MFRFHKNSISKYEKETREPSNDTLIALSYLFNVSVDFLLGITDIRDTSITDEILKYLKVLTEDDLQSLLKVARYLKWQEEHREEEQ
ncbi:MAG: helix-turn-helix domain-containing protein [Ruminococcus sp.]